MGGRAGETNQIGSDICLDGFACKRGGLGEGNGRFLINFRRIQRQHKQHLLQRRIRLRQNSGTYRISSSHAPFAPLFIRLLNASVFRFFAPFGGRLFGSGNHRLNILISQGHLPKKADPESHGVAKKASRKAANEAARLLRKFGQPSISYRHMLPIFHGVNQFQGFVVNFQPADGGFRRTGQRHHLGGNQDIAVCILRQNSGDARFGLLRDGQRRQFIQCAEGDAL